MKNKISSLLSLFALAIGTNAHAQLIHHEMNGIVDIGKRSIEVTDSIRISGSLLKGDKDTLSFYLNSVFTVKSLNKKYKLSEIQLDPNDTSGGVKVKRYMVSYPKGNKSGITLPLLYSGVVGGEIKTGAAEVARGFSETPGIICDKGIYMSGSTAWVPYFEDATFTFNLTTVIDSSWSVVSQGTGTKNEIVKDKKVIRYESSNPSDEVYLVAAQWTEYNKKSGNILVQAVLRTPDQDLANKYLDATSGYLQLYEKLVGPYPYTKFTLVENFWETGYGMPSFTLLGEKIIRFPFILTSSYPHELLHNYWGNSVYVDGEKGNWCEGLTAYMADHLIKEQQGQGSEYRRVTLQKFTDFVNENNDFPVSRFRSRHTSAEEAIGYGKVTMINEMLRYKFGDEVFKKAYAEFYSSNKFKKASFDDIRIAFEKFTGVDMKPFFDQWVQRTGAPNLKLENVSVNAKNNKYELSFTLSQVQKEDPFMLDVPVAVYLEEADSVTMLNVPFSTRSETFTFNFDKRPARIDVDPQFNVFRRLDKREVPLTLSQVFGDTNAMIILPKSSPALAEYTKLAEQWKQTQEVQGNKLSIVYDADLKELPAKASWIIGFENKFAPVNKGLSGYSEYLSKEIIDQADALIKTGGLIYVLPNPANRSVTNAFIATANKNQVSALARKLPHYSKYSYLGFEGDAGENKLKGEFPAMASPLVHYIHNNGQIVQTKAKLKPRKALAY